jgi:four helix bundle suffix protein/CRISPR-associated endonuclease Cas3-HD
MIYYAHSENSRNEKHHLSKHLRQTAKLVESYACRENYKPIFYLTGLLHDLGKYQTEFQNYLENCGRRGSVPHASWGAGYARLNRLVETSIAIDGHHKGLPDNSAWKSDTEPFKRGEVHGFEDVVRAFECDTQLDENLTRKDVSTTFADPIRWGFNGGLKSRKEIRRGLRALKSVKSGQNIAEGCMASGTSKKTELKLIGVARASLEELLLDFQDFLRQKGLALWGKEHSKAKEVRGLCYRKDRSYKTYKPYIEGTPEIAANTIICVIHQTNYLLDQQLRTLEKDFLKEGGFTERLYHARSRARDWKKKK